MAQEMTAEEVSEFEDACTQTPDDKKDAIREAIRREHHAIRRVWPRLW